jgi:hypothetical protein
VESLKPQDVVVVLKLCVAGPQRPSMAVLGVELGLSASEVHAAIRRLKACGLLHPYLQRVEFPPSELREASTRLLPPPIVRVRFKRMHAQRPNVTGIVELLVHGLKYVFPPSRGQLTRGMPTSYAAPPLDELIAKNDEPVPVWPDPDGKARGTSFEPLYRTVPYAASRDAALYELLALADALREGRARERKLAEDLLREKLREHVA